MNIEAPFEATMLSQTKPGDLIRLAHSSGALGLVIHMEGSRPVVGVLRDERGTAPYHIVYQRDFACFRYNPGWLLELRKEDAVLTADALSGVPGVVHVGQRGTMMTFAPYDHLQNGVTVNLSSFEWDEPGSHAAAFPVWTIWSSAEDRERQEARPIIRFAVAS